MINLNAHGSRGRVLLVDDSPVVRAAVGAALRQAGYLVDVGEDGRGALKLLEGRRYDAVVTDLQMPGIDGFAVLEAAKRRDPHGDVLVFTGTYADDRDSIIRALRLGASDFLVKSGGAAEQIVWSVDQAVERRRQREQLRVAEAQYRQLVELVRAIVWRSDAATRRFTFVSPEAQHILGYPAQQWQDSPGFWLDHVHPEDRGRAADLYARAATERGDQQIEYRMLAADGRTVWLQDLVRVAGGHGQPEELVGVMIDVTRRKLLEEELRQAQKMEAFGQLAGGVAHDFNNVLGVILGYSDLVLRHTDPQDQRHPMTERIRDAAERGAALTQQLLAFSRKQVLQPKILNLNEVVSGILPMLRPAIGEHIELVTRFEPQLLHVLADPGQLGQVVLNLVVNARDAMPAGGKLVIETSNTMVDEAYARFHPGAHTGCYALLAVSDTGTGMDAATLSHVFEPFFTTKEPNKGTGLGLATAYGIVQQSGGHMAVYSEPGHGSAFKVYLPEAVGAGSPSVVASERDSPLAGGSETVLVVEDDQALREITRELLEESGYAVLEGGSPALALALMQGNGGSVQLLLTDVVMPEMSGPALAAQLVGLWPRLRVLFMSGYPKEIAGHDHHMQFGTPFIQKPFTRQTLLRKVRETLDR